MIKELSADECLTLIDLLGKLPDIRTMERRISLLDGVKREVRNHVGDNEVPATHLGLIVNTLGNDTFFKLTDGSYPILTVIRNAQSRVKGTMLYTELQNFEKGLQDRISPLSSEFAQSSDEEELPLQEETTPPFQAKLSQLSQAIVELSEQLQSASVVFSREVFPAQCKAVKARVNEKCITIYDFSLYLRQVDNLPLEFVAHDIWLRKDLAGFDREVKDLRKSLVHFEEIEAKSLKQPQNTREEIQDKIGALRNRCISLLDTLKELQCLK